MNTKSTAPDLDVETSCKPLTPKEQFDVARELIKHEDGLVNSRVTWLQVFEGLLLTAFVGGIGLYKEAAICSLSWSRPGIATALILFAVLGISASYTAYTATRAAISQIESVEDWWHETGLSLMFPPIAGSHGLTIHAHVLLGKYPTKPFRILGAHMLLAFIPAWIVLLTLSMIVGYHGHGK